MKFSTLVKIFTLGIPLICIAFLLFLLWETGLLLARHQNNYLIWRFQKSIQEDLILPSKTEILSQGKDFGLLWGNSNHCDVEIFRIVQSSLSPEKFREQFQFRQSFKTPYSGTYPQYITVYHKESDDIQLLLFEEDDWFHDRAQQIFDQTIYQPNPTLETYLLLFTDQSFEYLPLRDIRCH